jgi:hypothetical protein
MPGNGRRLAQRCERFAVAKMKRPERERHHVAPNASTIALGSPTHLAGDRFSTTW